MVYLDNLEDRLENIEYEKKENKGFVHLHVHSEYSLLDGMASVKKLPMQAKALGMSSLAITDHGSMFGAVKFSQECKKQGIKPIIGCEVYTAERGRYDKDAVKDRPIGHLVLLCKNTEGYKNLIKIVSKAYTEGFYYKPRVDMDLLREHHEGLIALSGCLAGKTQRLLLKENYEGAKEEALRLKDIFGAENFYLEIQDHGQEEDKKVIKDLIRLSKDTGIPLVATNDSHYVYKEDNKAHEILLCMQMGSTIHSDKKFEFSGPEYYLKSPEEMRKLFSYIPEACDNTLKIADQCNFDFEYGKYNIPKYDVPAEFENAEAYFRHLCYEGLKRKYKEITEELKERLEYEISVIVKMGFVEYFLIVWDFINYAKTNGIPVGPGRGCTTADTDIYTENGLKSIKDVKAGEKVYTHNGTLQKVLATFEYPVNETLYKIKCFYGDSKGDTYTGDHKILAVKSAKETDKKKLAQGYRYTETAKEPEWIAVKNLEVGDLVVVPKFHSNNKSLVLDLSKYADERCTVLDDVIIEHKASKLRHPVSIPRYIPIDEDFAYVLGAMTGNGWIDRNKRIGFCCNSENINNEFLDKYHKVFRIKHFNARFSKTTKHVQYTVTSRVLTKLFAELWENYDYSAKTKTLPEFVFDMDDDSKFALIKGLWDTDGSHKGKSKYTSASKKLIDQIRTLLCMLNIPNGTIFREAHYSETGKVKNSSDSWQIIVPHNFKPVKANGEIKDEYCLKRIYNIEKVEGENFVYDINVDKNHSYVTSSFAAHNSAAGSVVAYCLSITEIEPMKYDLFFERFLNPERVSMPDIDVDFCIKRRGEVIDYVTKKYGEDNVCQISTFGTMKAKMAVRDVARVLEVPYAESNRLAKMIPDNMSLSEALESDADLKNEYLSSPQSKAVIDMALKLENVPRHTSTHAAGVVIAPSAVDNYVPLVSTQKGIATQYTMTEIESLGLLKMDFLGLRNLTVIQDTLSQIKNNYGKEIDLSALTFDDPKVYEMLSKGKTVGVFQLESKGITDFMKKLKPSCFEDIIAGVALYRPGPMDSIPQYISNKKRPDKIKYLDDKLASILDVTYGIIIYQEQVMQIVQKLAGYSFARADMVRRAMSKKKADVMAEERNYFINGKLDANGNIEIPGCVRNGISKEAAEAIFDEMESFAQYAFNKSHATAYSVITYQTAWLKCYYPSEFMAALMTSEGGDHEHLAVFIQAAKKMNVTGNNKRIKILPPDINKSKAEFSTDENGNIRYGLAAIKGLGEGIAEEISNNTYSNFIDVACIDKINSKAIEALAYSGALKSITPNVASVIKGYEKTLQHSRRYKPNGDQISFFDTNEISEEYKPHLDEVEEYDKDVLMNYEKHYLGVYITEHPLKKYKQQIKNYSNVDIDNLKDGILIGMITNVKKHTTKQGARMAFITMEDINDDKFEVVVFPKIYEKFMHLISEGSIIAAMLRVNEEGSIFLDDASPAQNAEALVVAYANKSGNKEEMELRIRCSRQELEKTYDTIKKYPGKCQIRWYEGKKSMLLKTHVKLDTMLLLDLQNRVGEKNVKYAPVVK